MKIVLQGTFMWDIKQLLKRTPILLIIESQLKTYCKLKCCVIGFILLTQGIISVGGTGGQFSSLFRIPCIFSLMFSLRWPSLSCHYNPYKRCSDSLTSFLQSLTSSEWCSVWLAFDFQTPYCPPFLLIDIDGAICSLRGRLQALFRVFKKIKSHLFVIQGWKI